MAGGVHGRGACVHGREMCMAIWVCMAGGPAWLGGMCGRGHAWQGVFMARGACMAGGGHAWPGVCMARGTCRVKGGHACMAKGGAWQRRGMYDKWGNAWQRKGMCGKGHVVKGECVVKGEACVVCMPPIYEIWPVNAQVVHILLECILVLNTVFWCS